jgi:peroxiredoxin Q/BCP
MATPTLAVGDLAPPFVATTGDGATIRLADYLGKRGLVLFFYPRNGTPVCTKQACAFRDAYTKFVDAGFEVIGVSSGSPKSHLAFSQQHQLPFPLISDSDGSLRALYGASKALGIIPGRVTYVIDRDGRIRMIYSALFASDEHVRQALAAVGAESEKG